MRIARFIPEHRRVRLLFIMCMPLALMACTKSSFQKIQVGDAWFAVNSAADLFSPSVTIVGRLDQNDEVVETWVFAGTSIIDGGGEVAIGAGIAVADWGDGASSSSSAASSSDGDLISSQTTTVDVDIQDAGRKKKR
jgi:hypothetical protein